MGYWKRTKSAISSGLEYFEGKARTSRYVLHPDHAYLGQKYYQKESKLPVRTAESLTVMGPSGSAPAATSHTASTASSLVSKEQEQAVKRMQPHVHLSPKSVPTPVRLPEDKYVVLRYRDLMNDDKVDATVDRDRDLYWAIKTAVLLIIQERAEAQTAITPVRDLDVDSKKLRSTIGGTDQEKVMRQKTAIDQSPDGRTSEADKKKPAASAKIGTTNRNLLESRSVEDFFADSPREVIDTLPTNPLLAMSRSSTSAMNAQAGKDYTNPLDRIPWMELVILFRHDTKELFARKVDGRLYPVLWKRPTMRSPKQDDGACVAGVMKCDIEFTKVEGQQDSESWEKVDIM